MCRRDLVSGRARSRCQGRDLFYWVRSVLAGAGLRLVFPTSDVCGPDKSPLRVLGCWLLLVLGFDRGGTSQGGPRRMVTLCAN